MLMKDQLDTPQTTHEKGVLTYSVATLLQASEDIIWKKLTDIDQLLQWDSMLVEMKGAIGKNGKIELRSAISPSQTFKLKVTEFIPNRKMVWSSSMGPLFKGVRTYELIPNRDGTTLFRMNEKFSGLLLPLMKRMLPDCNILFGTYIRDLNKEINSINLERI